VNECRNNHPRPRPGGHRGRSRDPLRDDLGDLEFGSHSARCPNDLVENSLWL